MLSYPAKIEPDENAFLVTFRDIPEAITGGATREEALAMAEDCLDVALAGFYADEGRDLPTPSKARKGEVLVSPSLPYALKLSLYQAMRDDGVRPAELARRLNVDHKTVSSRIMNFRYAANTQQLQRAFKALGRRPVVSIDKAA